MAKTYQDFANAVCNEFLSGIKEKGLLFFDEWHPKYRSINGKTNANYRGCNHFSLSFDGYADTRYFTYKQISEMGYKLKEKQKARPIVKFAFWDKKNKKYLSQKEYDANNPDHSKFIKYYYVFNAEQIEGFPIEENAKPKFSTDLIAKIAKAMGVKVANGTEKYPCYSPKEDTIYLPSNSLFVSQKGLYSVGLHELAHASGHPSRLNRKLENEKHTKEYAYEELVAEMSSALLSTYLGIENVTDIDNHKAYVNSWVRKAKDKPQEIINAFKEAEQCMEYIVDIANLTTETTTDVVVEKPKATTKVVETVKAKVEETKANIENVKRQTSVIENGIEYLVWQDGNSFIKLTKDFYMNKMSKKEKRRLEKLWA